MPAKKKTSAKSTARRRKTTSTKKKTSSTKSRAAAAKKKKPVKASKNEVTIDRRSKVDRRHESSAIDSAMPKLERRAKVQRRRQIDPTTCERDYSVEEVEFMNSMDDYKRKSGRMFPTCSEVLEVIRDLGYVKLTPAELATVRPAPCEEPVTAESDQPEAKDVPAEPPVLEPIGAGAFAI